MPIGVHSFHTHPELRLNGITLSDRAHLEFHLIYGRKNNTPAHLMEYLAATDQRIQDLLLTISKTTTKTATTTT